MELLCLHNALTEWGHGAPLSTHDFARANIIDNGRARGDARGHRYTYSSSTWLYICARVKFNVTRANSFFRSEKKWRVPRGRVYCRDCDIFPRRSGCFEYIKYTCALFVARVCIIGSLGKRTCERLRSIMDGKEKLFFFFNQRVTRPTKRCAMAPESYSCGFSRRVKLMPLIINFYRLAIRGHAVNIGLRELYVINF